MRSPLPLWAGHNWEVSAVAFAMSLPAKIVYWLETHWIAPAYVGWVLLGLAIFFFAAATNTLAGWLYVMSGTLMALLAIAALLPPRNLSGLELRRRPLRPVSVGELLLVEVTTQNNSRRPKTLLQLQDNPPAVFQEKSPRLATVTGATKAPTKAISLLEPGAVDRWQYELSAVKRGIYRWDTVDVRTAAPLGLFWCRRHHLAKATATIYPQILPLRSCPMLDALGQESNRFWHQELSPRPANEGITRALRPYRWGDSIRLIHWRSSARYGDLRVRELEQITTGHHVTIALNTADTWTEVAFEQAVVAAASLFMYAVQQAYSVALWTPSGGLQSEQLAVLSTLAAIQPGVEPQLAVPAGPAIWLTMGRIPETLPSGSHVIGWQARPTASRLAIHWMDAEESLQIQLQALR